MRELSIHFEYDVIKIKEISIIDYAKKKKKSKFDEFRIF